MLARSHFWMHRIGTLVLLIMLNFLLTERIGETSGIAPLAPVSELAIILGAVLFAWNIYRNAR